MYANYFYLPSDTFRRDYLNSYSDQNCFMALKYVFKEQNNKYV